MDEFRGQGGIDVVTYYTNTSGSRGLLRTGDLIKPDGQGSLACCDSWGRKKSDMTEQLN